MREIALTLSMSYRKEEAVALLHDDEGTDRDAEAMLARRKEPSRCHNCVISAVLHPKDDVPDLANDFVVGTSNLCADDLVRPTQG